jgi:hypothetical protein
MNKNIIYIVIGLTLLSLSLTLVPNVSAQTENIKVLNYSYQIDAASGILIVYGEIQNVGSNTLTNVVMMGTPYSSDGTQLKAAPGQPYAIYIVPGQKLPFEIDVSPPSGQTWASIGVSKIEFVAAQGTVSNSYPYPDVKITSQSSSIDTTAAAKGTYWVSGSIQNNGSQTAQNIYVVATFYNSSGTTVSAGWSNKISNLSPSASTTFKVGAFDKNMSEATPDQQISSYSLTVRPGDPILNGTAPDASVYSTGATSSSSGNSQTGQSSPPDSSSSGQSSGDNATGFSIQWLIYAAIIIVVIVAVVITIKTLPKRKTDEKAKAKRKGTTGTSTKAPSKKPQGKVRLGTAPLFKYFLGTLVCL